MRIILLLAALFGVSSVCSAGAATVPDQNSPDIFQVFQIFSFPSGVTADSFTLPVIPSDKRLVIQSVSFYARGGTQSSNLALIVSANFNNQEQQFAFAPLTNNAIAMGGTFPTTIYAGSQTRVTLYVARTPDDASVNEAVYVTLSGYYVTKTFAAP